MAKQNTTEKKLFELRELSSRFDTAIFAGVMQQEGWRYNTAVTVEEFELAVAKFTTA